MRAHTHTHTHTPTQGARSGLLLAPSFIAVVVAVLVWYMAYNTKLKLQE